MSTEKTWYLFGHLGYKNFLPYSEKRVSSAVLYDENIRNISVSELGFSKFSLKFLEDYQINTLEDLLTFSKQDILSFASSLHSGSGYTDKSIYQIIDVVTQNGFRFIDDLSVAERREILNSASYDMIMKSSVNWIIGDKRCSFHKRYIEEFLLAMKDGTIRDESLFDALEENNIHIDRRKIVTPIDELLDTSLFHLPITYKLAHGRPMIVTLNDFLYRKTTNSVRKTTSVSLKKREETIDYVHSLGLCFSDEVPVMKGIVDSIVDQLGSVDDGITKEKQLVK